MSVSEYGVSYCILKAICLREQIPMSLVLIHKI